MLATEVELSAWCPVHVAMLRGEPRLCWDHDRHLWFLVLSSMTCPGAQLQSDCIQRWIAHLVTEEISPEAARAQAMETRQ